MGSQFLPLNSHECLTSTSNSTRSPFFASPLLLTFFPSSPHPTLLVLLCSLKDQNLQSQTMTYPKSYENAPPFCFPQMCAALCWVPGIHGKQDKAAPRSSQSSCFQSASNDSTCADAHPSPPFHSSHDHPARCTTITARTCKNVSPNLPSLPQTSTHPSRSCPLS